MRKWNASLPRNASRTNLKRFKVIKTTLGLDVQTAFTRRDFAKIYLLTGQTLINANGRIVHADGPILLFDSLTPFSLTDFTSSGQSFSCLFSENLLRSELCSNAYRKLMTFAGTSAPLFFRLDSKQKNFIAGVFEQIILEQDTPYIFSHELFCNYMNLILHEVLKKTAVNIPDRQPFHLN